MPAPSALVSINEEKELMAQKELYEKIVSELDEKRSQRLARLRRISLVHVPGSFTIFAVMYWVIGLRQTGTI